MSDNSFTLTLWRHGEIANGNRLVGQTDLPLTTLGWQQSLAMWQRLQQLAPVSALACSPLQRCRAILTELHPLPLSDTTIDLGFAEMDFGCWENTPVDQLPVDWVAQLHQPLLPTGGETLTAMQQRVERALFSWLAQTTGPHRVLLTHAGVIHCALATLLQISRQQAKQIAIARGGMVQLMLQSASPTDLPAYLTRLEPPCVV